jgi:hypothetical protein
MVLMNIKLDPALHKFRHYAEYRNMPHRALSKPGLASKSEANPFLVWAPMRHKPVWFTAFSGRQATHHLAGRVVACFLWG